MQEIELIKRCQKKMQGLIARAEAQVKWARKQLQLKYNISWVVVVVVYLMTH